MLTIKQQKVIKYIFCTLEVLFFVVFISLCVAVGSKNKTIKSQNQELKYKTEQIDSLQRYCNALGAEEVFTVNVNFNLTQKNILSFSANNCQNIAKEVASMTRQQLYDSLYAKKNTN